MLAASAAGATSATAADDASGGGVEGAIIRSDSVRAIAENIGIENLDAALAEAVAAEVEYRLRQITQDALKFANHCYRDKLLVQDVDSALRLRNVPVCVLCSGRFTAPLIKVR